jgi:hypothetical protein
MMRPHPVQSFQQACTGARFRCALPPGSKTKSRTACGFLHEVQLGLGLPERQAANRAAIAQSFCDCMKRSKVASVKRNHRFWSARNFA